MAQKNLEKGVETLRRLRGEFPEPAHLLFLGLGCLGNQRVGGTNQMSGGWHGQTAQNRAKAIPPGRTYMYTLKNSIFRGPKMFLGLAPLFPGSLLDVLYVLYLTCQAAEPPLFPGSLLYVLYVLYLTRQPTEHPSTLPGFLAICAICAIWVLQGNPLFPGSLLYVLYVLYLTRQAAEHPLSPKNSKRRIQRILLLLFFSPTATQQTENKIQNNKQTNK